MTTVGLELTSFIDPSLTWKTVSKGRSTSRRSRNMKLVQEPERTSPKRQTSEGSVKSNMSNGRRFSGNMEHIPIKKRRFLLRSPSPPLQSANEQGESDVVGGQCTSDQCTSSDVSLESLPVQINDSNAAGSKNPKSDAIIDESRVKSSAEVHGTGDDFSGIAILAAAACSDRLDNSSDVKSHSQLGGPLQHESSVATSDVKENIMNTHTSELLEADTKHGEEACVVDKAKANVQSSARKESDDVVMNSINEPQEVEQNKSIAFTSVDKESFECLSLSNSLKNNDEKQSISDLPNEVADKTPENSGTSRDCRLHWDLNTVMDEWDDPFEDTGVVSSAQALPVAPLNIKDSESLEDVDGCKASKSEIQHLENVEGSESVKAEATQSCDNITTQVEVCTEPERMESDAGFNNVSPTIGKVEHCSELSSCFVTSILKENSSPSKANDHMEETNALVADHKIHHCSELSSGFVTSILKEHLSPSMANDNIEETSALVTDHNIEHTEANDIEIDHSLSLGLSDIKVLASDLEDGELREPHCWEDNEGEELETEHVDYDSDNRDEIVYYEAANDSVHSAGQALVRDYEKQGYHSDNLNSDDHKSNEENCPLRFEGCLSTMDSVEAAVCTKLESPALKACSGVIDSAKVQVDQKGCRSSIEADNDGKDFEIDPPRNARGASDNGRDLEFPDRRCADSMRRSRSSNFECMHNSDGRDESGSLQPSVRMGRFSGRTWNSEEKSIVGNTASEDDSERIIRTTGDTSPVRSRRPRIINTSRGGYHFVRRGGSPGERDGDYGIGMMKVRDFRPDNNPRNRFGRFNGLGRGGLREGYRRPNVYDPLKSGGVGPVMNRFTRRERSFSPVGDRLHRKSRSRSRTRSPVFRSEARMGRGRIADRIPYQQSDHAAEHPRERRSPPPRVFNQSQRYDTMGGSPGRMRSDECIRPPMRMRFHDNTTTSGRGHDFDEGNDFRRKPILMRNNRRSRSRSRSCSPDFRPMRVSYQQPTDQIRQRRSPPVRVFRPDQRFETGGSPVRIRSDECSRPMMRPPPRFSDSGLSGRGHDFNSNNSNVNGDGYRRKPRNIFERIHPVRQYDMEGDIRRLPYDEEGSSVPNFRRNENYVRGPSERRPVEFRGPREERGNVRYNNNSDRMFYSGPKPQFGGGVVRDFDDEGIQRRVRP